MRLVTNEVRLPQTKQRFVYQTLRDAIMRCDLEPGQRLIIEDIAQQLSVSPIPVREALQLLQAEGLVDTVPHVGCVVAPISRTAVAETFSVLEGLEIVATRTAAERLTEADVARLSAVVREMDEALQAGAHERWSELNTRFHLTIARITAMPVLEDMTARVLGQWDRVRRYFFRSVLYHRMSQSQQEHHAILHAMQTRDDAELERLVKAHNQGALAAYLASIASEPVLTTGHAADHMAEAGGA